MFLNSIVQPTLMPSNSTHANSTPSEGTIGGTWLIIGNNSRRQGNEASSRRTGNIQETEESLKGSIKDSI